MVRTQIQLPEEQYRWLRRWARRLGISLSEAVRRGRVGVEWNLSWFDGHTERGLQYPGRCVMPPRKYKTFSEGVESTFVICDEEEVESTFVIWRRFLQLLLPFGGTFDLSSCAR